MNYKNVKPYPGYEGHVANIIGYGNQESVSMADLQSAIKGYSLAEGTTMEDISIDSKDHRKIKLHIIKPASLPEYAPMILDIHGGGWVSGDVSIDNFRNIYLAEHTPCIVVAVEYTLASETVHFPIPLEDCIEAYKWLYNNGMKIGGDIHNIGLHGTSAGGNLACGLLLWARDHNLPLPKLTVLNCSVFTFEPTQSKKDLGSIGKGGGTPPEYLYCGTTDPKEVSPYAMPAYMEDLSNLPPVSVIVAEYDPLRDEGIDFAYRLLKAQVPTELIVAPRVSHGYCSVPGKITTWTHDGICASFRREFGMEI